MKRILLVLLVLIMTVGTTWAQFGARPSGFAEYRSEEQQLTFFYPDGWFVSEADGNIMIANREALTNDSAMDMPEITPGDTALVIGIMPTFLMAMMGIPVDSISGILDGMFQNVMSAEGSAIGNNTNELYEFDGRSVATTTFDDSEQEVSGIFFVSHEQEEVIMFGVAYGFRNSLDSNREALARLVSTAEFTGDLESMLQ
jgi:hypothetical protein